jgi:hypothetical protein
MSSFFSVKKKGVALVLAYITMLSMAILSGASVSRAVQEVTLAKRTLLHTQATYIAESAVEKAAADLVTAVANADSLPTGSDVTTNGFLGATNNATYRIARVTTETNVIDAQGIVTKVANYLITATATQTNSDERVVVNQMVTVNRTYTFQHAVFYNDDLEMLPGKDMTLSGKVHSNNNIYLGCDQTFTINSNYLRTAGDIYVNRKDANTTQSGTVRALVTGTTSTFESFKRSGGSILESGVANFATQATSVWNGTVRTREHGVTQQAVPTVAATTQGGYYASRAGLRIIDGVALDSMNNIVTLPAGTISSKSFKDVRENRTVTVTEVDMAKLNASGHFPGNGLLYVSRSDGSSSTSNGVRLVNGATLNAGLTVVSNNPVYVQGDYNSTSKKPAAIISDALNLLSNAWADSNSTKSLSNRIASSTTVNAAFIAGIKETPTVNGGNYSGGLENYPRLHEDWSSKTLTIRGAFVELWQSQQAQGAWGSASYSAPTRNWDYDTDFNTEANLPPFTPHAVSVSRSLYWFS